MDMVNIRSTACPTGRAGGMILEAAREAGIDIPTLCFLKDVNQIGACRICMVEVKGAKSLVAACVYPVNEGMEVFTNTPKVQKSRKMTLELLLSVHDRKCLSCKRSGTCELQKLCNDMGIDSENRYEGAVPAGKKDYSTLHLERDNAKCILCRQRVSDLPSGGTSPSSAQTTAVSIPRSSAHLRCRSAKWPAFPAASVS